MKDVNSYIDNALSMTEKLCRQIDDADTKWQLALIYNELAEAKVALLQSPRYRALLFGLSPYSLNQQSIFHSKGII